MAMCPRCGGTDPLCKMCPNAAAVVERLQEQKKHKKLTPAQVAEKKRRKEAIKKQKELDEIDMRRDKWMAGIWIRVRKYMMTSIAGNEERLKEEFNLDPETAKVILAEVKYKFGDWVDGEQRKEIPEIIHELLKVPF